MVINGWDDYDMDWEKPDPSKLCYIYALWEALHERIIRTFQLLDQNISIFKLIPPPQKNDICSTDYLKKLIRQIQNLIINEMYIDMEFNDYSSSPVYLKGFPKSLDYTNFTDDEKEVFLFPGGKYGLNTDYVELYKKIKSILSKFRYSRIKMSSIIANPITTTNFPFEDVENLQGYREWTKEKLKGVNSEAFCGYPNKDLATSPIYTTVQIGNNNSTPAELYEIKWQLSSYKSKEYSKIGFYMGAIEKNTLKKNSNNEFYYDYVSYLYIFYASITLGCFPDAIPDVISICYSTSFNDNFNKNLGMCNYKLDSNSYWSGSTGWVEGLNVKNLGKVENGKTYQIGSANDDIYANLPYPNSNNNNYTATGSLNFFTLIYDWGTDTGFKFK